MNYQVGMEAGTESQEHLQKERQLWEHLRLHNLLCRYANPSL